MVDPVFLMHLEFQAWHYGRDVMQPFIIIIAVSMKIVPVAKIVKILPMEVKPVGGVQVHQL